MPSSFPDLLAAARTPSGADLLSLSRQGPLLVTFLRHLGCTFCREALAALGAQRGALEAGGTRLAFVHMATEEQARALFERFGLGDVARVADPDRALYRAFGLERGGLLQLFGPGVVARGIGGLLRGHGLGRVAGDPRQMPGVFLLRDGRVVRAFRHATAGDSPDYEELAREVGR
jgi:hypothetical protein